MAVPCEGRDGGMDYWHVGVKCLSLDQTRKFSRARLLKENSATENETRRMLANPIYTVCAG